MRGKPRRNPKTTDRKAVEQTDCFTALVASYLNERCVKEYRFHPVRRWRFDYAIPEHKIALEVEGGVWTGGRHIRGSGFLGDMEKYNAAATMGWRLLRCTPKTLHTMATLRLLKAAIRQVSQEAESGGNEFTLQKD